MKKLTISLLLTALSSFAQTTPYSFESISLGSLAGNDGWVHSPVFGNTIQVTAGTGFDTTRVLTTTAYSIVSRPADSSLSAASNSGFLRLQADYTPLTPGSNDVFWFGVGVDANSDGKIDPASEMQLGIAEYLGFIYVTRKGDITSNFPDTGTSLVGFLSSGMGSAGDWIRLRADFDFVSGGGVGTYSVSYENLTRGDTSFTSIISGASLSATTRGITPASLNGVFVGLQSQNQADNLLTTTTSAIPEPSTYAAIFGLIALGLAEYRKRDR